MIDRQMVMIAGSVAGATAVSVTLLSSIYSVFREELGTTGAIIIATMGLVLFALLVLSITNRVKLNQMKRGDSNGR